MLNSHFIMDSIIFMQNYVFECMNRNIFAMFNIHIPIPTTEVHMYKYANICEKDLIFRYTERYNVTNFNLKMMTSRF